MIEWSSVFYSFYLSRTYYKDMTYLYGATYLMMDGSYRYFPPEKFR